MGAQTILLLGTQAGVFCLDNDTTEDIKDRIIAAIIARLGKDYPSLVKNSDAETMVFLALKREFLMLSLALF